MLVLLGGLIVSANASGRSATDDAELAISLTTSNFQIVQGAKKTTSPFGLGFDIGVDSGNPQTITMRVGLPAGLQWGFDGPDPGEGCAGTAPAVCVQQLQSNPAGTVGGGWNWNVVADRPGSYEVTASVQTERSDPNPSNNTGTLQFEIVASAGGGGGGGGGGSVSVSAGAVKLTPAKPKAGSVVLASATVTADGSPVKPSKVSCTGRLAGKKLTGKGTAATGKATCRYATPKIAKGKTLAGSMGITARGKTVTKRFATRLG
jgi:hypothetical protein